MEVTPGDMSEELHEELRRHAGSLRGLARDLLRDPHAADDVTQQTLQQALQRRPVGGPLGGWLSRTLVNFTRQWHRSERRRAARETTHARHHRDSHAQPTPPDVLARREMLHTVTNAVLQLDEPYQTAIFLRYFENLPPRSIAHQTDVNVATVKSRLARALVMLRRRLDQRNDCWRPALVAAFGLPAASILAPIGTGVLIMKTSLKVAAASVAVAASSAWWFARTTDPAPPRGEVEHASQEPASAAVQHTDIGAETPIERSQAPSPQVVEPWLRHPFQLELEVSVIDSLGLPVAGFAPELAPVSGKLCRAPAETGADGKLVIAIPARVPRIELEVLDPRKHRHRVVLRDGRRTHVTLLSKSKGDTSGQVTLGRVALLSGYSFSTEASGNKATMSLGLHPYVRFHESGVVRPPVETTERQQLLEAVQLAAAFRLRNHTVDNIAFDAEIGRHTIPNAAIQALLLQQLTYTQLPARPVETAIEGTVFAETGEPAANVPVVLLGHGPQPLQRGETDEQGQFRFGQLKGGNYTVRAGGDHQGLGTARLQANNGTFMTTLQLRRGACVGGTLLTTDGTPIADATIEWRADNGTWADSTTTNEDGTFLLANMPATAGHLVAWSQQGKSHFPIAYAHGLLANTDVQLTGTVDGGSTLRFRPQLPQGVSPTQLRVRIRQLETGFSRGVQTPPQVMSDGTHVALAAFLALDEAGPTPMNVAPTKPSGWQVKQLPVGDYEIELWLPGSGHRHVGRHWIDGENDVDLGTIALPRGGTVQFERRGESDDKVAMELIEIRRDFDLRIETLKPTDRIVHLAPGNYALIQRQGNRAPVCQRFTVRPEQTTAVHPVW